MSASAAARYEPPLATMKLMPSSAPFSADYATRSLSRQSARRHAFFILPY